MLYAFWHHFFDISLTVKETMNFFQQDCSVVPTVYNSVYCSESFFFVAEWGLWPSHSPCLKLIFVCVGHVEDKLLSNDPCTEYNLKTLIQEVAFFTVITRSFV
jgi:hypothetical protein